MHVVLQAPRLSKSFHSPQMIRYVQYVQICDTVSVAPYWSATLGNCKEKNSDPGKIRNIWEHCYFRGKVRTVSKRTDCDKFLTLVWWARHVLKKVHLNVPNRPCSVLVFIQEDLITKRKGVHSTMNKPKRTHRSSKEKKKKKPSAESISTLMHNLMVPQGLVSNLFFIVYSGLRVNIINYVYTEAPVDS